MNVRQDSFQFIIIIIICIGRLDFFLSVEFTIFLANLDSLMMKK